MRNITVSVDHETHRLARIRATESETSVSALVRSYPKSLVRDREVEAAPGAEVMETEHERRRRLLGELFEDIRTTRGEFKAADNVSREELHKREAIR